MNHGEIWWVEHPEVGRRPACILTRQAAIALLPTVLVAPATRTIRKIPTEVRLGPADGMPEQCALSFDSLATIPKSLFTERITRVSVARLPELHAALAIATGGNG